MTDEEMLFCLQEIEQTINIKKLVYGDIAFWPQLRIMLYAENAARNGGNDIRKQGKKNTVTFILSSFFERFYDVKRHLKLKQADCYFLTASNSRYLLDGRGYFDTFVSPLVEWTDVSCHIDEQVPMGDYRLPRAENTSFIQHNVYLKYLQGMFFTKLPSTSQDWVLEWYKIETFLSSKDYQTDIDIKAIEQRLKQLSLLSAWFLKRLKKIKPKIILVMCYYTTPAFALIYAAKQLGIVSIDLQHGVQGNGHIAYAKYYNLPEKGWSLLPDAFWNWTKKDAEYISSWGDSKHRGLNGGMIWHQYLQNTPMINRNWLEKINKLNTDNKLNILVTFQPLKDNDSFIDALTKAISSKKGKAYFWLLRLHPGMFDKMEKYKQYFNMENCSVELATVAPLPLLLNKTILHITRYSSVVIEAAMYSVPSFVEEGKSYYKNHEQNNQITYFSDNLVEQFLAKDTDLQNNCKKNGLPDSARFWHELLEGGI